MFYASTAGSAVSMAAPMVPGARSYYPAAPMTAMLPGQAYYPTMHAAPMTAYPATAAPMVMHHRPQYSYAVQAQMPYGYHQPTVIVSAPPSHRRHRSRSRQRTGGFLGYL